MNESLQTSASPVILLIGAAIFAILFTVILTTLRRAEVFPASASVTPAICASLLAVMGIMRTFRHAEEATGSPCSSWMDVILLPNTAMGISIPLVLLVPLLCKLVSKGDKPTRTLTSPLVRRRNRGETSRKCSGSMRNQA